MVRSCWSSTIIQVLAILMLCVMCFCWCAWFCNWCVVCWLSIVGLVSTIDSMCFFWVQLKCAMQWNAHRLIVCCPSSYCYWIEWLTGCCPYQSINVDSTWYHVVHSRLTLFLIWTVHSKTNHTEVIYHNSTVNFFLPIKGCEVQIKVGNIASYIDIMSNHLLIPISYLCSFPALFALVFSIPPLASENTWWWVCNLCIVGLWLSSVHLNFSDGIQCGLNTWPMGAPLYDNS
jgi:hypothetical protein